MGSFFSSSKKSKEEIEMALNKVKQTVSSTPVVVFRVKQLFTQLGASYKTIELDEESDGDEMQAALAEWTGQMTVPNVFIGGIHIGGCDSVVAKHQAGQLVNLLTNAGAIKVNLNA
ncbi:hypothetical protein CRYUN_Cryun12cG0134100 [Craigia yunnanensis]